MENPEWGEGASEDLEKLRMLIALRIHSALLQIAGSKGNTPASRCGVEPARASEGRNWKGDPSRNCYGAGERASNLTGRDEVACMNCSLLFGSRCDRLR